MGYVYAACTVCVSILVLAASSDQFHTRFYVILTPSTHTHTQNSAKASMNIMLITKTHKEEGWALKIHF